MEFENVREVIDFLFELGDPETMIFVDGRDARLMTTKKN